MRTLLLTLLFSVPACAELFSVGLVVGTPLTDVTQTTILAGINYLHELQMATSLMHTYSNVSLETSCIMGYAAIEKTVQQCGHHQLLFGSGAPLLVACSGCAHNHFVMQ